MNKSDSLINIFLRKTFSWTYSELDQTSKMNHFLEKAKNSIL